MDTKSSISLWQAPFSLHNKTCYVETYLPRTLLNTKVASPLLHLRELACGECGWICNGRNSDACQEYNVKHSAYAAMLRVFEREVAAPLATYMQDTASGGESAARHALTAEKWRVRSREVSALDGNDEQELGDPFTCDSDTDNEEGSTTTTELEK